MEGFRGGSASPRCRAEGWSSGSGCQGTGRKAAALPRSPPSVPQWQQGSLPVPCYHPFEMFPARGGGRWTSDRRKAAGDGRMFNCNRCQGCRARKTAEWTYRLEREAAFHEARPLMITLTYANEHLPPDFSVSRKAVSKFLRRLRRLYGCRVRFFAVGEYGDAETGTKRPHYHIILFGLVLSDLCDPEKSQRGFVQYRSPSLESVWSDPVTGALFGRVRVSFADRAAMSYCAGYVHKKLGGPKATEEYRRVHPLTGEVVQVEAEFALMSRRPGIGGAWFDRYAETDARSEFVISDGRRVGMPGYFRRKREEADAARLSEARVLAAKMERRAQVDERLAAKAEDLTEERLLVREEAHRLRTAHLARGGA